MSVDLKVTGHQECCTAAPEKLQRNVDDKSEGIDRREEGEAMFVRESAG